MFHHENNAMAIGSLFASSVLGEHIASADSTKRCEVLADIQIRRSISNCESGRASNSQARIMKTIRAALILT
jgi:hypothetical protein